MSKLNKNNFNKNVLTLITGSVIAQGLPIALSPILTRIYTPDDFGVIALYMAITMIFSSIATGRYELAIMLPKKDSDALTLLIISALISFFISLLSLLIVFIFNHEITVFLGVLELSHWLYFIPLSIFLSGIYQASICWCSRNKEFKDISQNKILQSGSLVSVQLIFSKLGSAGLVIGYIISQVISVFMLVKVMYSKKKSSNTNKKIKMYALAKRYKNFPLVNTWSALLNIASLQVPVLMLTTLFNASTTGFFSLSQRIIQMPMSLIGVSIGQVYYQRASKIKNDKIKLKKLTLDLHNKLLLIGIFPTLIILSFGDDLFAIVFGETWRVAGEYAQLLSIWVYFVFVSSPLSHLMTIYEKHKESVIFNAFLFVSRISSLLLGWLLFNDPHVAIGLYALVGTLVWSSFVFYLMKIAGVSYAETANQLYKYLAVIAAAALLNLI
ncbi:oligosaccharide flippase family protein [Colwellia sp. MB02u-18]|uniref:lipopolysaccharide biosynthesis protein n=1 Tax=unclassified Colwellia TaxID=196834 RepID=UPI0015F3D178|nr:MULTISPECIES: oligosaccharide flippase family protein [unclassified Colwellia]MBA6222882.1 oligosaccharide flippase family protein [Colwellia sp. MB3u-45]MBA6267821.1 oligosaccharide flippase family protein [Colwellia sp. MB3u-43]MBA6322372.1 oligosaccharide flippase family protein [Colwellia sp. MB02u-19]MBA6324371.1 oligosaccharide flippase family protein [Colwellia sp. MB02u-18]MBA6332527.1 oligosaccharide flippase family protein [Colwellia sp. MB02u-12]